MPKKSTKKSTKRVKKSAPKRSFTKSLSGVRGALAFGLVFISIGLGMAGFQLFNLWQSQQTSAATQPLSEVLEAPIASDEGAYISGIPVHISIPSVDIDLEVIRGYHYEKSNTWTLTLDKAQWGVMTPKANDKSGATFIYGHYRQSVFSRLPKIKTGEKVRLETDQGHTFTYVFRASSIVPPSDTSVFKYRGKPILILQTCTGVHFENRQLFVFDLEKVE